MIRTLAARASRTAAMAARQQAQQQQHQARFYALDGAKGFSDRESAIENLYFNKEDEHLLRKLLSKVKSQTQTTDPSASMSSEAADLASLRAIVGKYSVSEADMKALLHWKHAHY
jgi:hypothetical protein